MDIAEALQAKGYEIDRRRLTLNDTIKELGDYTVKARLHRDVTIEIPIEVTGEGGIRAQKKSAPETAANSTENENDAASSSGQQSVE
jgi:large subunit ribosomal protein L9